MDCLIYSMEIDRVIGNIFFIETAKL